MITVEKNLTGQIIPFKQALQQLLSIKAVTNSVLENFKENEIRLHRKDDRPLYKDIWDGELLKSNPIFKKHNGHVLGVQVWFDEVELCDSLGSRAGGKNKLAIFQWTLMNLPPECRSNLRGINLLGIVEASLLKKHGAGVFLRKFLDEMRDFEEGLSLTLSSGETRKLPCILTNLVGDMPALNFLGGFKESSSNAFRPCRICFILRKDLDFVHSHEGTTLRDKSSHEKQVEELLTEKEDKVRIDTSKNYGINNICCFSVLPYFDCTKCLSHDLMHLLYEGVLKQECQFVLQHLIVEGKIDIDNVNNELESIVYSREFTKPLPLSKDEILKSKKMSLSSAETHSLCTVLPIVLSKFVNFRENRFYSNFLLLLEIAANAQSYWFTENDIEMLSMMISSHNRSYVKLYPKDTESETTITPKLHALLHLPFQIRLLGPPRYAWCYRYESKNVLLKQIMRRNSNNRNIAFTVASFCQTSLAKMIGDYGQGDFFETRFDSNTLIFKTRREKLDSSAFSDLICQSLPSLQPESFVIFASGINISGRDCTIGSTFLYNLPGPEDIYLPVFWQIAELFILDQKPHAVMQMMSTEIFQQNSFSFIIKTTGNFEVIELSALQPFIVPMQAFQYENVWHVIPNYYHLL